MGRFGLIGKLGVLTTQRVHEHHPRSKIHTLNLVKGMQDMRCKTPLRHHFRQILADGFQVTWRDGPRPVQVNIPFIFCENVGHRKYCNCRLVHLRKFRTPTQRQFVSLAHLPAKLMARLINLSIPTSLGRFAMKLKLQLPLCPTPGPIHSANRKARPPESLAIYCNIVS